MTLHYTRTYVYTEKTSKVRKKFFYIEESYEKEGERKRESESTN